MPRVMGSAALAASEGDRGVTVPPLGDALEGTPCSSAGYVQWECLLLTGEGRGRRRGAHGRGRNVTLPPGSTALAMLDAQRCSGSRSCSSLCTLLC